MTMGDRPNPWVAFQSARVVLPVVHHANAALSIAQAELALACGADGVFLISHGGRNADLAAPAQAIKARHPDKAVGLNLLGEPALDALKLVVELGLDMVWTDDPGVTSAGFTEEGSELTDVLWGNELPHLRRPKDPVFAKSAFDVQMLHPLFFGSVAFKYQPFDPMPEFAARFATMGGMIPTTSGPGTGQPPDVAKLQSMRDELERLRVDQSGRPLTFQLHSLPLPTPPSTPLAIASGMTPENLADFLPHVTHFLVATGVSTDMHHFDGARLRRFVEIAHSHPA